VREAPVYPLERARVVMGSADGEATESVLEGLEEDLGRTEAADTAAADPAAG